VLRSVLSHFASIVISLIFAIVVWAVAIGEQNPSREAFYSDPLPIEIVNRPDGTMIYSQTSQAVRVKLRAPQVSFDQLQPASFKVVADLDALDPGLHQVTVKVQVTDPRVTVMTIDPPSIGIRLEQIVSREFDLHSEVLDAPPIGYEYRAPSSQVSKIKVSGPAVLVEQVVEASASIYLRSAKATVEREVAVQPLDARGNVVPGLTLTPSTVAISVPVDQRVGYKDVSIRAVLKGTVASGYWISNILVVPPSITIAGSPDALGKIPGFVETIPIDVNAATLEVTKLATLSLPEGVSVLSNEGVTVQVSVTPILGGQTIRRKIILQGLRRGYNATVSPDTVEIILSGPLPALQNLAPDDVQVVIDVSTLSPGVYQLKPRIPVVPDTLKVQNIVPDTVQVTIVEPIPTPTPTPTITPTATVTFTATLTPTIILTPTLTPTPTPAPK
jgi:YbbR domain-containing protein